MSTTLCIARRLIGFALLMFGAATFAAPPQKVYTLSVTNTATATNAVPGDTGTGTVTLKARFDNVSPVNANSSWTSMVLQAPVGAITIEQFVSVNNNGTIVPAPSLNAVITADKKQIRLGNLNPVGRNQFVEIVFTAKTSNLGCGASLVWNPNDPGTPQSSTTYIWTGSGFSGDEFDRTGTQPTSNVQCSLVFVPPPVSTSSLTASSPIKAASSADVAVCLWNGNACDANYAGNVTINKLAGSSGQGVLSGNTASAAPTGTATFAGLTATASSNDALGGSYQLQATDGTKSTTIVTIFIGEGILSCDGEATTNPTTFSDLDTDAGTSGIRGTNKDGSPCIDVNYSLAFDPVNNRSVFSWDIGLQPGAVFKYSVSFLPEFVGTNGLPSRVTKVQWYDSQGNPTPAAAVQARACLSADMPKKLGTLAEDALQGDTSFQVTFTVSSLPPVPFPIVINKERMQVNSVTGSLPGTVTLGVVRGNGGTQDVDHLYGTGSTWVMSTPFPLDGVGATAKVMLMCIAKESWQPVPRSPTQPDCDDAPTAPTACTQNTTTIIDGGDGIMIRG